MAAVIVMPAAGNEVQPTEFVTVNEYVLGTNPDTTVIGAAGVKGCELIKAFADRSDIHPDAVVTVKL